MSTRGWEHITHADIAVMKFQAEAQANRAKRSKYRNVKTVIGSETFDSKREADHWLQLQTLAQNGQISQLRRQEGFDLLCPAAPDGSWRVVARYIADFAFIDSAGKLHVQDVKGGQATKTQLYRLKAKWLYLQTGIEIEEIQ